jgi:hypothetical protein
MEMYQELITNFRIFQAGCHGHCVVPSDPPEAQLRPDHIAVDKGSQHRVGWELWML